MPCDKARVEENKNKTGSENLMDLNIITGV
jgi:hypothetical protein